ncbi:hypothetical protein TWF694_009424 [Orbilia ellipsospora]|uniref:Uncharacterized protein n=1 Tax=Orbilia ellipsospora TaxID=2528407 RepID=A0AAV9XAS8_9PEZI
MAPPQVTPLTSDQEISAFNLTQWLDDCEDKLSDWEKSQTPVQTLSEKDKIRAIAKGILDKGYTKNLYIWYNSNPGALNNLKLGQFLDRLKEAALGRKWGLNLLRDLYTSNQGPATVKEYLYRREELFSAVSDMNIGTGALAISEFEKNCHYLFQADPMTVDAILDKELDNDVKRLGVATEDDVTRWLKKYDSSRTEAPPPAHPSSSKPTSSNPNPSSSTSIPAGIESVSYMLSPAYGVFENLRFNDLENPLWGSLWSTPGVRNVKRIAASSVNNNELLYYRIDTDNPKAAIILNILPPWRLLIM